MQKLTNREEDIMQVFWTAARPLSSNEVTTLNPKLSQNTVQALLKKLTKKGFLKESGIDYSGTSITRKYKTIKSEEDYFFEVVPEKTFKKALVSFISEQNSSKDLKEVEKLVQNKLNELEQKKGKD